MTHEAQPDRIQFKDFASSRYTTIFRESYFLTIALETIQIASAEQKLRDSSEIASNISTALFTHFLKLIILYLRWGHRPFSPL